MQNLVAVISANDEAINLDEDDDDCIDQILIHNQNEVDSLSSKEKNSVVKFNEQ